MAIQTVLDTYDRTQLEAGGTINEDLMQRIFDISEIPLPFTNRIGRTSHSNPYFSWQQDRLRAPDTANAVIDGSPASGRTNQAAAAQYSRVGNHSQISIKNVEVSNRLRYADTAGYGDELARQIMRRGNELRRDVEAMALLNNTAVTDTGSGGAAGEAAGLEAWVADEDVNGTTIYNASAGSASQYRDLSTGGIGIGGWPNITPSGGVGNVAAVDYSSVIGVNALTEESIKDVIEQLYTNGIESRNNYVLMARPGVIRRLSEYMFTSAAKVGTLINQEPDGQGQRTATGTVNVFNTDFGVLEFAPNRLMQVSGDGSPDSDTVFIFDPGYLSISYMRGYNSYVIGKTGLTDEREIAVDWSLRVHNWEAVGAIFGVDVTADVTA